MFDFHQNQHSHPEWTPPAEWTAPEGWTCSSYGNDTCPSYTHPNGMIVFVEYPEGQRECEGVHQYTVFAEYGECDPALLETDSYSEFVAFINQRPELVDCNADYNVCHNSTHEFCQKWWFGKLLWAQRTRNALGEWFGWGLANQDVAPWGHVEAGPHPETAEAQS